MNVLFICSFKKTGFKLVSLKIPNIQFFWTISFMYILKNNGPNIDPCGIPILISSKSESC